MDWGGRKNGIRLVCDPHCASDIGLSHEMSGTPEGPPRRGHGIAPVLARAWIGQMELLREESLRRTRYNSTCAFLCERGPFYIFNLHLLGGVKNIIKSAEFLLWAEMTGGGAPYALPVGVCLILF